MGAADRTGVLENAINLAAIGKPDRLVNAAVQIFGLFEHCFFVDHGSILWGGELSAWASDHATAQMPTTLPSTVT